MTAVASFHSPIGISPHARSQSIGTDTMARSQGMENDGTVRSPSGRTCLLPARRFSGRKGSPQYLDPDSSGLRSPGGPLTGRPHCTQAPINRSSKEFPSHLPAGEPAGCLKASPLKRTRDRSDLGKTEFLNFVSFGIVSPTPDCLHFLRESKEPRISARATLAPVAGQPVPGQLHCPALDVAVDVPIREGAL